MKGRAMLFALVGCLLLPTASAQVPTLDAMKSEAVRSVDSRKDFTQVMVDSIFSFSELAFQETQTSKFVTEILEKEEFQVQRGVAGMPTVWVASWEKESRSLGFMADIDGLPETSQKPVWLIAIRSSRAVRAMGGLLVETASVRNPPG